MRQLQFFTSTQLAQLRDRSASRNYSPERDEFRREHERQRAWGLSQRYAAKQRRLQAEADGPAPSLTGSNSRPQSPRPATDDAASAVELRPAANPRSGAPTAIIEHEPSRAPEPKAPAEQTLAAAAETPTGAVASVQSGRTGTTGPSRRFAAIRNDLLRTRPLTSEPASQSAVKPVSVSRPTPQKYQCAPQEKIVKISAVILTGRITLYPTWHAPDSRRSILGMGANGKKNSGPPHNPRRTHRLTLTSILRGRPASASAPPSGRDPPPAAMPRRARRSTTRARAARPDLIRPTPFGTVLPGLCLPGSPRLARPGHIRRGRSFRGGCSLPYLLGLRPSAPVIVASRPPCLRGPARCTWSACVCGVRGPLTKSAHSADRPPV
jgi:hypothetical protein